MSLGYILPNLYLRTGASVGVVIPSTRLLVNQWGREIDACDVVFRFNGYKTAGMEACVGTKTTHVFSNALALEFGCFKNVQNISVIEHSYEPLDYLERAKYTGGNPHYKTDLKALMEAAKTAYGLEAAPSSGLACLLALQSANPRIQSVKVFGYDFRSDVYTHYTGEDRSVELSRLQGHDINAERKIVAEICKTNNWQTY